MTPYLLNLCDLFLTLYALSRGGVELNPLMQNPAVMVAWKVGGVGAFCALMQNVECRMQNCGKNYISPKLYAYGNESDKV